MASLQVDAPTVAEVTNQTEETTKESSCPGCEKKLATTEAEVAPKESEKVEPKEVVFTDEEDYKLGEEENEEDNKAAMSPTEDDDFKLTDDIENDGHIEEDDDNED
jgi:uncharacterized Zn finger protein (UPF0148 family)